jgi:hypothetical protein
MPNYTYITDQIFTVDEFFTPQECEKHIALAEEAGFGDAPINSALGVQIRKDVRNNTRVMVTDVELANHLFGQIRDYIPLTLDGWTACGLNERFRYYRYEVGQQFDWHYDGRYERENGERSKLTFMIYLNEGFEGGETSFERLSIQPRQGQALFFIHELRHKGQPVVVGKKYVLRTDVMYR